MEARNHPLLFLDLGEARKLLDTSGYSAGFLFFQAVLIGFRKWGGDNPSTLAGAWSSDPK